MYSNDSEIIVYGRAHFRTHEPVQCTFENCHGYEWKCHGARDEARSLPFVAVWV
jgi:hypothetical protein